MAKRIKGLDEKFSQLADKIPYGHLHASTDPVLFITLVIEKIEELEKQIDILRSELRYARDEHGC